MRTHPFHIVTSSPWPLFLSIGAGIQMPVGTVLMMHGESYGPFTLFSGLILWLIIVFLWWNDVVTEGTYQGLHTSPVQRGLRLGFILFIISEVMFFFSFFWAFFHSSLAPIIQIGSIWPPFGILPFNPWSVPLLNTFILLTSGITITAAHHYLVSGEFDRTWVSFSLTIGLAVLFTLLQLVEYIEAPFTIADGIYGSVFFMATGFHGLHVIIGTTFIAYCFIRFLLHHFTRSHHVGFECAAWYWHFVDVVWLFLFITIYWWGSY
jgi:cytochrome c oxidase subunit 3